MPALRMQLDGQYDKALQLKPGEKQVSGELLSLIRSSRAAVLLYRDRV